MFFCSDFDFIRSHRIPCNVEGQGVFKSASQSYDGNKTARQCFRQSRSRNARNAIIFHLFLSVELSNSAMRV